MSYSAETNNTSNQPDFYEPLRRVLPVAEQVQGLFLYRAKIAISQLLKNSGARIVLDVCCGSGCLTCRLSRAGFEVTGVDSSPTMLDRAKTKHRGAHFVLCEASQMPFAAAFDAAIVSLALHEMDPPLRDSVWETMRRAVRPGGLLIALDFTVPKDSKWHSRLVGRFIDKDERQVGRVNPAHYENYREFMSTGGLEEWLVTRERNAMTRRFFAGGNLGVFAVAA